LATAARTVPDLAGGEEAGDIWPVTSRPTGREKGTLHNLDARYTIWAKPYFPAIPRGDPARFSEQTDTTTLSKAYTMNLTDTASWSWLDTGADERTDGDSVTGEADSYLGSQLNSVTDNRTDTSVAAGTGGDMQSFSLAEPGCETLSAEESDCGVRTLGSQSDPHGYDREYTASDVDSNSSGSLGGSGWFMRDDEYSTLSMEVVESDLGPDPATETDLPLVLPPCMCVTYSENSSGGIDGPDQLSDDNATGYVTDNGMSDVDSVTTFGAVVPGLFFCGDTGRAPEDSEGSLLSDMEHEQLTWAYSSPTFDPVSVAGSNPRGAKGDGVEWR